MQHYLYNILEKANLKKEHHPECSKLIEKLISKQLELLQLPILRKANLTESDKVELTEKLIEHELNLLIKKFQFLEFLKLPILKEVSLKERDQSKYFDLIQRLRKRSTIYIPIAEIKNFPIQVLQLSIEELELFSDSTRIQKCLTGAKINTIGDVLEYGYRNLLRLKNFGERSYEKVFDVFKSFLGIELEIKKEKENKMDIRLKRLKSSRRELTLRIPEIIKTKTFHIKCEKKLSSLAKSILQSAQSKHFYYVRDDINSGLKSNPIERDFLLQSLYSIVIFVQNNLSTNFLNIWIKEIYINKIVTYNKFINQEYQNLYPEEYITIKLACGYKIAKKPFSLRVKEFMYNR